LINHCIPISSLHADQSQNISTLMNLPAFYEFFFVKVPLPPFLPFLPSPSPSSLISFQALSFLSYLVFSSPPFSPGAQFPPIRVSQYSFFFPLLIHHPASSHYLIKALEGGCTPSPTKEIISSTIYIHRNNASQSLRSCLLK
jgi:hypothetical protein